jgi:rubrerythrin
MAGLRVLLVWGFSLWVLTLGLSIVSASETEAAPQSLSVARDGAPNHDQPAKSQTKQIVVKGNVECLDAHGQPTPADKDCADLRGLVLRGQDGQTHSFVSTDALGPMLADSRVRGRLLQITAVEHSDGHLEALTVQSIKAGKLYDIYYFCQLCNITTYTPGLCPCCRQELEFREAPATEP